MTVTMDIEQVEGKLRELIAGREDHVYSQVPHPDYGTACVNWTEEDGKRVGSCLVGKFYESTVGLDDLPANADGWSAHTLTDYVVVNTELTLDEDAEQFLEYVQAFQDQSVPWGEAIEKARRSVINMHGQK